MLFIDTSDENKCNWMMFVRPAQNFAEQNLVMYQHGQDIYYTVIKPIDYKTELKVNYPIDNADVNNLRIYHLFEKKFSVASYMSNHLNIT